MLKPPNDKNSRNRRTGGSIWFSLYMVQKFMKLDFGVLLLCSSQESLLR